MICMGRRLLDGMEKMHGESEGVLCQTSQIGGSGVSDLCLINEWLGFSYKL